MANKIKVNAIYDNTLSMVTDVSIVLEDVICGYCGQWITDLPSAAHFHGNIFCKNCVVECNDCGRKEPAHLEGGRCSVTSISRYTLATIKNRNRPSRYLCHSCRNSGSYHKCYGCGYIFKNDKPRKINDRIYCKKCYERFLFKCASCGKEYDAQKHRALTGPDRKKYCEKCYNKEFMPCDMCGNAMRRGGKKPKDVHYDDVIDAYFCDSCWSREDSWKPRSKYRGKSKDKLYFGAEIEMEKQRDGSCDPEMRAVKKDTDGFFYAKGDGSLLHGFEAVTHPFTFEWMKENASIFDHIWKLRKKGYRSYNTTTAGVHIHMTAAAFDNKHLYRFLKFFYMRETRGFIKAISQRTDEKLGSWASFSRGPQSDDSVEDFANRFKTQKGRVGERYSAVNLQNKHTIEIRIFRGTLNPAGFFKDVEFCHAAFWFTKGISLSSLEDGDLVNKFVKFVIDNKKEYPHLLAFINNKSLASGDAMQKKVAHAVVELESLAAKGGEKEKEKKKQNEAMEPGDLVALSKTDFVHDVPEVITTPF